MQNVVIQAPDKDWLVEDEAAAYFGLSTDCFRELVRKGVIPQPKRMTKKTRRWHWKVLVAVSWLVESNDLLLDPDPVAARKAKGVPTQLGTLKETLQESCPGPGVYLLFKTEVVVYIGSGVNAEKRAKQHATGTKKTPRKDFDRTLYYPTPLGEMIETEKKLVAMFDPPLNQYLRWTPPGE